MMFTFCVLFCLKLLLLIKRSIFVKFSELSILIISHNEFSLGAYELILHTGSTETYSNLLEAWYLCLFD